MIGEHYSASELLASRKVVNSAHSICHFRQVDQLYPRYCIASLCLSSFFSPLPVSPLAIRSWSSTPFLRSPFSFLLVRELSGFNNVCLSMTPIADEWVVRVRGYSTCNASLPIAITSVTGCPGHIVRLVWFIFRFLSSTSSIFRKADAY